MALRFGIDLGGTKTEIVGLDPNGSELYRKRVPTPSHDYDAIVQTIVDLVHGAEQKVKDRGTVGIGTPGAISPATGRMKNSNTICLNGKSFDRDLTEALGRDVRLANDANCFALSEAVDGAARGARVVFGVILGTGTGGGLVVNGSILVGPHAIAGEWGHNPLPWMTEQERKDRPCYCGKQGCIETFLCGPGLSKTHLLRTGTQLTAEEIGHNGSQGERAAATTLDHYIRHLARSLSTVINLIDPDVVVFGGGLSQLQRIYEDVPRLLADYVFSDTVQTKLVPAAHGDSSGTRGAAWLWP